mgnify:CR=1 FL=1
MPIARLHRSIGVKVGHVQVGGGAPIVVQSMTMTDTADAAATARQCVELAEAGSEMVRVTVNLPEAAAAIPEIKQRMLDAGFELLAERWNPILDVFQECGVKFALEVHPTEIAFDIASSERALAAVNQHRRFGFNFDPSHLIHQFVDPVMFIEEFPDRIFHAHIKDSRLRLTGRPTSPWKVHEVVATRMRILMAIFRRPIIQVSIGIVAGGFQVTWFRDGTYIGHGEFYGMGVQLGTPGGGWGSFSFSHDDKQLVYSEYVSANESYLWLMDVASGKSRRDAEK